VFRGWVPHRQFADGIKCTGVPRLRLPCYTKGGNSMSALWRGRKRLALFIIVGAVCFSVQLAFLAAMVHLGIYRPVANAIGFTLSAQLNFLLNSRMTWRDRPAGTRRGVVTRWAGYNVTALGSLVSNTAVFTLFYRAIGTAPAALLGVIVGTGIVYLTCNLLVFRGSRGAASAAHEAAHESKLPAQAGQPIQTDQVVTR
jgi:putative flippase GtrA